MNILSTWKRHGLLLLVLLTVCVAAQADPFTLNTSSGVWTSVTPPVTVPPTSGVGTSQIRWGTPAVGSPGQSGYDYTGKAPPPVGENTEVQFEIGTFVHHNNPINDDSITGATLAITMVMDFSGTIITKTFTYNFEHVETPNTSPVSTCQFQPADGATNLVPCDDRVRVLNSIPDQTFTVGSTTYTLDLMGFSRDNGVTVSDKFFTTEQQDNTAKLFGTITKNFTPTVPEPSSIILLVSVVAGLGWKTAKNKFNRA